MLKATIEVYFEEPETKKKQEELKKHVLSTFNKAYSLYEGEIDSENITWETVDD